MLQTVCWLTLHVVISFACLLWPRMKHCNLQLEHTLHIHVLYSRFLHGAPSLIPRSEHDPRRDDLNPIPIRIQDERDFLHPAVRQLLLERDAQLLEALARGGDVGDGDRDVAEALARVAVS
ncbi:uncharacterized protein B0H18DRAFT_986289 [Fomitopsis serialis]|uniref:uncharacterized protein n=1 Tax=Fomitopsis serialis TaxID=139415 RepID=UPI0020085982|nr:uncharacterized protein B0H18DRAFT_986289 [Neoantrodia serialis]KAH9932570.1 hypothetical protein B0H18DRAFT_986289 [Neoantrodia serialis]